MMVLALWLSLPRLKVEAEVLPLIQTSEVETLASSLVSCLEAEVEELLLAESAELETLESLPVAWP